jgi:D-tyrosyl-tRNA(Tyr) deacylase
MKAVVQRVAHARVEVNGEVVGSIDRGLLVYLGVAVNDTSRDTEWLANKVQNLRIFEDEQGKMNRDVADVKGGVLVISQFTLLGDCKKGNRPSFALAMPPQEAEQMYESFVASVRDKGRDKGVSVSTGRFRADMKVHSLNDGPITMLIDSREGEAKEPGLASTLPSQG